MKLYEKVSFISIFSLFFWVSTWFYLMHLFYPYQLQTQQVMTSQIRSHIEYLIPTYHILVLIF